MDVAQRISEIIGYYRISATTLAKNCGYETPQPIYDLSNGRTKSITTKMANRILAAYPEINMSWLLTGEGNMIQKEGEDDKYITYLLPQSAMGGKLTGFAVEGITLPGCEKIISPIKGVDFAITVYGDSMSPEYPSGCRVLVKKIDPNSYIAWGNVYVIDTSNGVIIKEVQPSEKEGFIRCVSFNKNEKYKPFDVPMADVFGMYRVLCSITVH